MIFIHRKNSSLRKNSTRYGPNMMKQVETFDPFFFQLTNFQYFNFVSFGAHFLLMKHLLRIECGGRRIREVEGVEKEWLYTWSLV